jgi:sec-independent protein translocase protein TatA
LKPSPEGFFIYNSYSLAVTLLINNLFMNFQFVLLGVLGTQEIIIIAIIILLMFGGRKIPELMRGLGKGIREFNDAKNTVRKEIEESATEGSADKK